MKSFVEFLVESDTGSRSFHTKKFKFHDRKAWEFHGKAIATRFPENKSAYEAKYKENYAKAKEHHKAYKRLTGKTLKSKNFKYGWLKEEVISEAKKKVIPG